MRENPSGHQSGFESMERNNQREPMVSHQSETTPSSVADNWSGVYEMKMEAMDEAYGLAGRRGNQSDFSEAHRQFRTYNWA